MSDTAGVAPLPLAGVRVVEFVHMVMGPTCGMILGDLGAEVIKVEPTGGDKTRTLLGAGAGFFTTFNRNKKSLCVDLKDRDGREVVSRLVDSADVLSENFRPGAMAAYGLDYATLRARRPDLIYCSLKGFLSGPYENRAALDEVVQMMGGLAYMTGPPGRPLRAGSSVNDIMGGTFAAVAIMAALRERDRSGLGQEVRSALFENNVLLVAQHMMQFAVTGTPPEPMPKRVSAWAIYDVFDTADHDQVFVGIVSDSQWRMFCEHFDAGELATDERLGSNNARVAARPWLVPAVGEVFKAFTRDALIERCERVGLPYAPITRPTELFDDPHLRASGGLLPVTLEDGRATRVPALPIAMGGQRLGVRRDVPRRGEHTFEILRELGFDAAEIESMRTRRVVAGEQP